MEETELLNAVFRFKHKAPSERQDVALCAALAERFTAFVGTLQAVEVESHKCAHTEPLADDRVVPVSVFAVHELESLQKVCRCLSSARKEIHRRGDLWYNPWLPAYGCALQLNKLSAAQIKLAVLFVDGWERTLHFLPTGECVHSAVPSTHNVLHCADLDTALQMEFTRAFNSKLCKAQNSKGSERSAAANSLGHQKTPQFIAAVVRRAVASLIKGGFVAGSLLAPKGGTTDVGQHTGGRPRDTCWPLVQVVIAQNLCCGSGLFRKTMVMFKLSLLQNVVHEAESMFCSDSLGVKSGCACVDDMFFMLQNITASAVELLDCGYDVSAVQNQCSTLRSSIDGLLNALNKQTAKRYVLPGPTALQQLQQLHCGVKIVSPKTLRDSYSAESNDERRDRAWHNLEGCYFIDGTSCNLKALLRWEESITAPVLYKQILVLRTIEAFVFKIAHRLNKDSDGKTIDLESIQTLVTKYQQVVARWRKLPRLTSVLEVEQHSREMLVMWIAFCLVHQKCAKQVPLCKQYNIALDWKDLEVAVLSDRAAITALQHAATYIRRWNKRVGGPPLFNLSDQSPTFDFGLKYAQSCSRLLAIYDQEVKIWEGHMESMWRTVEQKKCKAVDLRAEICRLNRNLRLKQSELDQEVQRLNSMYPYNERWYRARHWRESDTKTQLAREVEHTEAAIRRTTGQLATTLKAPTYQVRPLPALSDDALQIIFMLNIPRNIEILGNLCLTAQRALAPTEPTPDMMTLPSVSPTTWTQFYYQHAPSRGFCATAKVFTVSPAPFSLPKSWGPDTVDDLWSLAQYKKDCVWNPCILGTAQTWIDSSGANVNPFGVLSVSMIDGFMEKLPESLQELQWMNAYPGGNSCTRGNQVYANLFQQPKSFEKTSFIALGSLRAFPNQQYRKLQWAILEDLLPWNHAAVKVVVRQSLYQIGVLTDKDETGLLWKTDMLRENGLETFCATLEFVAKKLKQTPRSFEFIPLLSELAGYAHQFTPGANLIVKMFAEMARDWAMNAKLGYESESSSTFRQKECILYGYALLSYTLGPWDDEVANDVCELVVLFRTSFLCASIDLPSTDSMHRVESRIAEMMARKIAILTAYVENHNNSALLCSLLRLVSETSPAQLYWSEFVGSAMGDKQFGSCFEAFDEASGTHYAINLFTGSVLINGHAPGGLPSDIREHERFVTLFGHCNFEVINLNGVFRTKRRFCGHLYDFALIGDRDLSVQELSVDSSGAITRTLQLCSLSWIKIFGEFFPHRLRELYCHWYWVEQNCVLFRPKVASNREVFFIGTLDTSGILQCYKVPFGDTELPYEDMLDNAHKYDVFVQVERPLREVFNVLAKFEQPQFLHPLKSDLGIFKIELPRFKMTFFLNNSMQFESVEHKGYALSTNQQFDDFLPMFSRYLVLELKNYSDISRPNLRLLLPVGTVLESTGNMLDVDVISLPDNHVDVACFDQHRRLMVFEAETISARLQLAAVYCRAGPNVPSKRLRMTGSEAALQLLQACRSTRPFSVLEKDFLRTISNLSYHEPAVKILAVALMSEANRLAFLFSQTKPASTTMASIDEGTEYADMCAKQIQRNPLRSQFRSNEESIFLGNVKHSRESFSGQKVEMLDPFPVDGQYVRIIEAKLGGFLKYTRSSTREMPQLILADSSSNAMSRAMLNELELSWKSYNSQLEVELKARPRSLLKKFETILREVSEKRHEMENYLWKTYEKATGNTRDCLLAFANYLPVLTVSDLVCCAFDDETFRTLMPNLCTEARGQFKQGILRFMALCVLEDKTERIIWKAQCSTELSDSLLVDELMNSRRWELEEFPYWLAFEVEGRLQIRHEQYVIARHLIDHPGTVCQLNMGRGKTRVILPMLFLHFSRNCCRRVVRAHFLGPLLSEARQFMHRYLSASNGRLRVFEQPFHRQLALGERELEFVYDALEELKLFGGIQMVAPEHRMSLELKRLELGMDDDDAKTQLLDNILRRDQYIDVLDESDALLHHKYHLVYAVGAPQGLCGGVERWKAAEALLRIMVNNSSESRVTKLLQEPYVSCASPDYAERLGAFRGTRLNAIVDSTEPLRKMLKKALVLDLIDNAPFELMWMTTFGKGSSRDALVMAISDSEVSMQESLNVHITKFCPYINQLLALRGLVAFGVLEHCMEKRYRVDYGLPFSSTRPKKIAIPYRAADVPSERSEFSHPDVCIVLTLLGYYHGGLSSEEIRNAFEVLLALDISAQQQEYDQWYTSVVFGLKEEERQALCDVRHISLTDPRQFEMLYRVYKFCMTTINFYLNACVFPKDTQQYPQRLSRTAWNLAAGDKNIGFSGTNDNHRLLPLSVTQREPNESSLLGTNAKMIDKILHVTQSYDVLRPNERTQIPWQIVLVYAVSKHVQAVIDTGALLAGVVNHDAASFLLEQPDFGFEGVTYYDSRVENNCWMVAEKARRITIPLKNAPMLEKETFVIFDEARSRGSDMKLLPNSAAVLTLGPKLAKDKLMQGAGRMRQLGCDQTLWIASFDEVAQSIFQASTCNCLAELCARDVLKWVLDNTQAEAVRGLVEWASNGIHFRETQHDEDAELVNENWTLEYLYQEKLSVEKIARVIESKSQPVLEKSDDELVTAICRSGYAYGLDDEVCITSHTDECERELQVEEELEEQCEYELGRHKPAQEKVWGYTKIMRAQSVDDLSGIVEVVDMRSYIRQRVSPKELANLDWPSAQIFGTENFFSTISARKNLDSMNEFLRAIDVMLVFRNGHVLLVSECEADHILELLWSSRGKPTACNFCFLNLSFACEGIDRVGAVTKFRCAHQALGSHLDRNLPLLPTIACRVYNGETMLTKKKLSTVELETRKLLGPLSQREFILSNFVMSRGNSHKWTRSFLHELCCRMDLKDSASLTA